MSSQGRLPYDRYKWSLLLLLLLLAAGGAVVLVGIGAKRKQPSACSLMSGGVVGGLGNSKLLGTPLRHETRYLAKYAEMSQGAVSTGSLRPRWDTRALKNIAPMDVSCNIGNQPKISKDQFMWGKTWGILIPQNPLPQQKTLLIHNQLTQKIGFLVRKFYGHPVHLPIDLVSSNSIKTYLHTIQIYHSCNCIDTYPLTLGLS